MSHFAVIVIGTNIEEQLEPYWEATENPEYVKFIDEEQELLDDYNNGTKDGVPFKEIYASFEEFVADWEGIDERDPVMNRYGRYANPNAKWDWWQVGGRFGEAFKKKGSDTWVNSITLENLDLAGMVEEQLEEANAEYTTLESILKGLPAPSWEEYLAKYPNIQDARNAYNSLEVVKDLNKAHFFVFGGIAEEYGTSREEYLNKVRQRVLVPFAFVQNGVWYEKGRMGWFGMSSNEISDNEWAEKFHAVLRELPPETVITMVDCHI